MEGDEEYVCRRRKVGEVFEIKCGKEGEEEAQSKRVHCVFSTEGKSREASALGFGAQYGEQTPVLKCFSEDEFKKKIAKELKMDAKNIKIIDEEQSGDK